MNTQGFTVNLIFLKSFVLCLVSSLMILSCTKSKTTDSLVVDARAKEAQRALQKNSVDLAAEADNKKAQAEKIKSDKKISILPKRASNSNEIGDFIVTSEKDEVSLSNDQFAGITSAELEAIFRQASNLVDDQIAYFINMLADQFEVGPNELLPIQGVLYASGINGALFVDSDEWLMNAVFIDPDTQKLVTIENLFATQFYNDGINIEAGFKTIFVFIPAGISINSLDGAIYGRGIGLTARFAKAPPLLNFLGVEGSWMPGKNREGSLFHVGIKYGIALPLGATIPKMIFTKRTFQNK